MEGEVTVYEEICTWMCAREQGVGSQHTHTCKPSHPTVPLYLINLVKRYLNVSVPYSDDPESSVGKCAEGLMEVMRY